MRRAIAPLILVTLLVACGEPAPVVPAAGAGKAPTKPKGSAKPSAKPSTKPSETPPASAAPSASPTGTPALQPTATPSPVPSSSPTATPTPAASGTPSATATPTAPPGGAAALTFGGLAGTVPDLTALGGPPAPAVQGLAQAGTKSVAAAYAFPAAGTGAAKVVSVVVSFIGPPPAAGTRVDIPSAAALVTVSASPTDLAEAASVRLWQATAGTLTVVAADATSLSLEVDATCGPVVGANGGTGTFTLKGSASVTSFSTPPGS